MKRLVLGILIVACAAAPLQAQGGRIPRKWLIAGVGALITGSIATYYAINFEGNIGGCSEVQCVVPVSIGLGALVGYMIGSEMDKLYALRYSHAPPIDLRGRQLTLAVVPNDVWVRDSTVLVTGEEGIEVVKAGPRLERLGFRARGLRGIGPVALPPASNRLLVGSSVGLYAFPLVGEDPGVLAYPGEVSALSDDGRYLALGLGPDVQLALLDDSVMALGDPLPEDARVVDLTWRGDLLWVLTEERLAAYQLVADSLVQRGSLSFPSIGRRLAVHGDLALVAAGSGGVHAVDLSDPDAPTGIANWSGARFAYDVDMVGGMVYVAAGPEGMYLIRLEDSTFASVGLSREVGFAAAVAATADAVYVLDRTGGALRRIEPATP